MTRQDKAARTALVLVVEAVSRLNVALQGRFLGGVGEAQDIAALLQKAHDIIADAPEGGSDG